MSKKIFKITGMDCDSCAKMIELDLEDAGFNASCSYQKQILEIEDISNSDEEKIKEIVTKGGYQLVN